MGLSIIAACLPTLRPLFGEWSLQGWYKYLKSYVSVRTKSHSIRPKGNSISVPGRFKEIGRESEETSNFSQVGILQPKSSRMETAIYPMMDLEAQTDTPSGRITVRNQIEQSSFLRSKEAN